MHSVVNESLDALNDPHVVATGLFSYLTQPGMTAMMPIPSIPGAPPLKSGTPRATAPLAGADTDGCWPRTVTVSPRSRICARAVSFRELSHERRLLNSQPLPCPCLRLEIARIMALVQLT